MSIQSQYNILEIEEKWYKIWEKHNVFSFLKKEEKINDVFKKFPKNTFYSIVLPPPNITGKLHIGHALNHTIQDVLIRYHRMQGKKTLWIPGLDHAGIATQNVVERMLESQNISRIQLGREKFEQKIWEWKQKYGENIISQQKKLGESINWEKQRFTISPGMSRLVRLAFVKLYNDKLIYRSKKIINWCPKNLTAISNLEVEYKNIKGSLYYISYPIANADKQTITIATTRPETMLGDEAIAVAPDDDRYKPYIGKFAIIPLIDKKIPIIADSYVDKNYGTGALKVTPAHDPNDFVIGQKHNLPITVIMDKHARINTKGKQYNRLDREVARKKIVHDLKENNFLEKIEPITHKVGYNSRSNTIIEPLPSTQWFLNVKNLAQKANFAVKTGAIEFIPKKWENTFFEWMNNIQEWCISRQLWWGHRIPAWYDKKGNVYVEENEEKVREKYNINANVFLKQDEDVLDTWFSSGLWPFSTLWEEQELLESKEFPKSTEYHKLFYPNSVLVTGFDIIFFWVARMIMLGMYFLEDVPFHKVYIHGLIRDAERKKMSKSKGNVIDPIEKMQSYGTDAFRFFLISTIPEAKDIIYNEDRLKGYYTFCNKIWNTARFILIQKEKSLQLPEISPSDIQLETDIWILSKLQKTIQKTNQSIQKFRFAEYSQHIYSFTWDVFCDYYIEFAKIPRISAKQRAIVLFLLEWIFLTILKILHPIIPYITEELHSYFVPSKILATSSFPSVSHAIFQTISKRDIDKSNKTMDILLEIVYKIRNIKGELSLPLKEQYIVSIVMQEELSQQIYTYTNTVIKMCNLKQLSYFDNTEKINNLENCIQIPFSYGKVILDLQNPQLFQKSRLLIQKERDKKREYRSKLEKKLQNLEYISKAPKEVINREKELLRNTIHKIKELSNLLK